ncbi:MAG: hypothetical protein K6T91_07125 [Firmicutes bacterium]|nr:hypothetical protein [Bacillota bacterium]
MEHEIYNIKLAHYIYVPSEDYDVIKSIWSRLVHKYGLKDTNPILDQPLDKKLTHSAPFLLKNSQVAIGLLVLRSITALEILYLTDLKPTAEIIRELADAKQNLQNKADYIIGETTVSIIGNPDGHDILPGSMSGPFTGTKLGEYEIKGVLFSNIHSDNIWHRYYTAFPKSGILAASLLTKKLPSIEALLFKLQRQETYFKDQRSFVNAKKEEFDRRLSDILNKWSNTVSSPENRIELLEKDIENLSNMYSELMGCQKLIKNSQNTVARDIDKLEHLFKNNETGVGLGYLNDSLLGKHKDMLQSLNLDAKLLHRSLDDTRAAIDVVRTRIDLERSRESVLLQKEGVSVQTAAGFIELFVVWFYTLEAWELLATKEVFEHIPIPARLGIDVFFAASVVIFTHYAAKLMRKEKASVGLLLSGLSTVVAILLMVTVTLKTHT